MIQMKIKMIVEDNLNKSVNILFQMFHINNFTELKMYIYFDSDFKEKINSDNAQGIHDHDYVRH